MIETNPELNHAGNAFAYTNAAMIASMHGAMDHALEMAQRGVAMSDAPNVSLGLALVEMMAGSYAEGLARFDARFYVPNTKLAHFLRYPYPRWDGTDVDTLYIVADGGMGDTLSFLRFVPRAMHSARQVILAVEPQLMWLADMALPSFKLTVVPQSPQFPVADAWCPIMGLPTALALGAEQICGYPQSWRMPHCEGHATEGWKSTTAKLHIGIAYAGSPDNIIDRWRSIPITQFLELYRVPGVQLYSLQVGDRVADLHNSGCAGLIRDMSYWIKDATDTAAIMRELDLIITVESFVGHLAGAMDKECWVLLSTRGGDWRCGRSGTRPIWYPNTRLFRQHEDLAWPAVFDDVVEALQKRLGDV
jgi:hypothetical protein